MQGWEASGGGYQLLTQFILCNVAGEADVTENAVTEGSGESIEGSGEPIEGSGEPMNDVDLLKPSVLGELFSAVIGTLWLL